MSNALVNAGLVTFQKIEETNPREIELASQSFGISVTVCEHDFNH